MNLIDQIKSDQLEARRVIRLEGVFSRDKSNLLTTLIGEAEAVGKNAGNRAPTDQEVVAVVKKFIKNLEESIQVIDKAAPDDTRRGYFTTQIGILSAYLPKQLTEAELESILRAYRDSGIAAMGGAMSLLKADFTGLYDGKMAASIAKKVFPT